MFTTIMIYVLLTILIAWFSILVLHFLVYSFFTFREEHEISSKTGQEVPTYHYAYSSLSLKFLWMDVIPNKVMLHPIKSLKMICKFFYKGYLEKKWEWIVDNVWIVNKIYMWNFRRIVSREIKKLKEWEKQKQK